MNQDYEARAYVVWNLEEAAEELNRTLAAIQPEDAVNEVELRVALAHIYNHLNTAWNARNATAEEISSPSHEQFQRWGAYPVGIDDTGGTVAA